MTQQVKSTSSTSALVISKTFTQDPLNTKKGAQDNILQRLFLCSGWKLCCQKLGVAALLSLFFTPAAHAANGACSSTQSSLQFDETVKALYIYDGDTLRLSDGRKIRLIGINTPELARKQKSAEPFAFEAKKALQSLLKKGQSIHLIHGKDQKDHYGRTLAHTFLTNGHNIQKDLIAQGLAHVIIIPPNTKFAACYLETENAARCNQLGLWKNRGILKAEQLTRHHIGFQLIQGTVKNITTDTKGIWLNIDDTLTVGIRPDNQHLFDEKTINSYLNQLISIRGWVNKSRKSTPYYLRVKHPLSIQLSSTLSCN